MSPPHLPLVKSEWLLRFLLRHHFSRRPYPGPLFHLLPQSGEAGVICALIKHLPLHQSGSLKSSVWVSAFPIPSGAPWRQRQGLNSVGVSPAPGQSLAQRCTPIPDKCSHAHPPQPPQPGWGQRRWWDGPQKQMATLHPTPASHCSLQHPATLSLKRPQLSACQLSPQRMHAGAPRPPEPALLSCGINSHGGKSLHSDQLPRQ